MRDYETEWMTAADLADSLGISLKTLRRRVGAVVDGMHYEERAVGPHDDVHHRTQALFRVRANGSKVVALPAPTAAPLPSVDRAGKLKWSEARREELQQANHELRRRVMTLEQQLADLEQDYRDAVREKRAAPAALLLDAVLSALGGVDEDDMREILAEAVREHMASANDERNDVAD